MSNTTEKLLDMIYELKERNTKPSLVTIDKATYEEIKLENNQLINNPQDDYNMFFGIKLKVINGDRLMTVE